MIDCLVNLHIMLSSLKFTLPVLNLTCIITDIDLNMCLSLLIILALFVLLAMAIYTGVTVNFLGKRFGDWRFSWSYILGWVALLMTFFAGSFKLRSAAEFNLITILLVVHKIGHTLVKLSKRVNFSKFKEQLCQLLRRKHKT